MFRLSPSSSCCGNNTYCILSLWLVLGNNTHIFFLTPSLTVITVPRYSPFVTLALGTPALNVILCAQKKMLLPAGWAGPAARPTAQFLANTMQIATVAIEAK